MRICERCKLEPATGMERTMAMKRPEKVDVCDKCAGVNIPHKAPFVSWYTRSLEPAEGAV